MPSPFSSGRDDFDDDDIYDPDDDDDDFSASEVFDQFALEPVLIQLLEELEKVAFNASTDGRVPHITARSFFLYIISSSQKLPHHSDLQMLHDEVPRADSSLLEMAIAAIPLVQRYNPATSYEIWAEMIEVFSLAKDIAIQVSNKGSVKVRHMIAALLLHSPRDGGGPGVYLELSDLSTNTQQLAISLWEHMRKSNCPDSYEQWAKVLEPVCGIIPINETLTYGDEFEARLHNTITRLPLSRTLKTLFHGLGQKLKPLWQNRQRVPVTPEIVLAQLLSDLLEHPTHPISKITHAAGVDLPKLASLLGDENWLTLGGARKPQVIDPKLETVFQRAQLIARQVSSDAIIGTRHLMVALLLPSGDGGKIGDGVEPAVLSIDASSCAKALAEYIHTSVEIRRTDDLNSWKSYLQILGGRQESNPPITTDFERLFELWNQEADQFLQVSGFAGSPTLVKVFDLLNKALVEVLNDSLLNLTRPFAYQLSRRGFFLAALKYGFSSEHANGQSAQKSTILESISIASGLSEAQLEALLKVEINRPVAASSTTFIAEDLYETARRANVIKQELGDASFVDSRHVMLALLEAPAGGKAGDLVIRPSDGINLEATIDAFREAMDLSLPVERFESRPVWSDRIKALKDGFVAPLSPPEDSKPLETPSTNGFRHGHNGMIRLGRYARPDEICLNAEAYAEVLARLLRLNDDGEFSLAIYGHWGRGKTFLMEQTEAVLNNQKLIADLSTLNPIKVDAGPVPNEIRNSLCAALKSPLNTGTWISLKDSVSKCLRSRKWWLSLVKPAQKAPTEEDRIVTGPFETVFFSAWKYPSRPEVWIHLYESIFQKLRGHGWWASLAHVIRAGIERHGPIRLFTIWFLFWLTALPKGWLLHGVDGYFRDHLATLDVSLAIASALFFGLFLYRFWKTKEILEQNFLRANRHTEKLGLQATIGDDLRALLKGWVNVPQNWGFRKHGWYWFWTAIGSLAITIAFRAGMAWVLGLFFSLLILVPAVIVRIAFDRAIPSPKRLLLVVDDLDRCPFEHLLSVIESIKLLNEDKEVSRRMRVVVLIEEDILKHAIWNKYKLIAEDDASKKLSTQYDAARIVRENCEKLFTAHLRLSALTPEEISSVVESFAKDSSGQTPKKMDPPPSISNAPVTPPNPVASDASSAQKISTSPGPAPTPAPPAQPSPSGSTLKPSAVTQPPLAPVNSTRPSPNPAPKPPPTKPPEPVKSQPDPTMTLSGEEKRILMDALNAAKKELNAGLGPRAIRAFLFRYQLARLILEQTKQPIDKEEEITELIQLLVEKSLLNRPAVETTAKPSRFQDVVAQLT